ncbi:MAG: PTS sugar transporter subunit IIA [Spirochaetaceae bacterium]|nr:PTS sugar transporter subunit IIA [Spirochaetaceae bacterium]
MRIEEYFSEDSVMFLNSVNKEEVLSAMVIQAEKLGYLSRKDEFKEALLERELIMSTDIGWKVAIPHAKLKSISKFFVIPAILKNDLDWGGGNNQSVNIVLLIGGPENEQTTYLQILSKVTLIVRNNQRRQALLAATIAEEVIAQFTGL